MVAVPSPSSPPLVAVVMGSDSDLPTMEPAVRILERFGVATEVRVLSAHRTPQEMVVFARAAAGRADLREGATRVFFEVV